MNLIFKVSNYVSKTINVYLKKEDIEFEKLRYGISILIINIFKLSSLLLVSYFLNILKYTIVYFICFVLIRIFSFGVHANSSLKCTLSNFIIFIGGVYLSIYIRINSYGVILIFLISLILLILYAPSDTKERPILSAKLRKKLKIKAVIMCLFLMVIAYMNPNTLYKSIITYAVLSEAVCTTPFIYKLFRKEYRNYEKFNL